MGSPVTDTYAVRPALYVKAEALPEKVEGIQVAFGGQWWYVVGQGEKGSVPGPENTVTLFENPWEKLGAQPVSAYTSASSYLKVSEFGRQGKFPHRSPHPHFCGRHQRPNGA